MGDDGAEVGAVGGLGARGGLDMVVDTMLARARDSAELEAKISPSLSRSIMSWSGGGACFLRLSFILGALLLSSSTLGFEQVDLEENRLSVEQSEGCVIFLRKLVR